jgi:hypothetical protein
MVRIDVLIREQATHVENHLCSKSPLQAKCDRRRDMTARVHQFNLLSSDKLAREARSRKHVVRRCGQRRRFVVRQSVPIDPMLLQFFVKLATSYASPGRVSDLALETEQRELDANFGQLPQVWNHLRLAERIQHSIVRNKENAFSVE